MILDYTILTNIDYSF